VSPYRIRYSLSYVPCTHDDIEADALQSHFAQLRNISRLASGRSKIVVCLTADPYYELLGFCAEWHIHRRTGGAIWLVGILNPKVLDSREITMFGYGLLGTIVIICVIVWIVKRV